MKSELLKIYLCIILLVTAATVFAKDNERRWITNTAISPKISLRMHWVGVYEGFDTVTLVEVVQDKQVVRSFQISGQPVFNKGTTYIAFPDCWDGGCSQQIRILDLLNLTESKPIHLEKDSFLKVSWETDHKLKVELGAMNPKEKTEVRTYDIK